MADNTLQGGTDNIATDDITTLNGSAQAAGTGKVQRVKPGYGVDGSFQDVTPGKGLPITLDGRRIITFRGRAATFRTPGRAGSSGQKILSLFNSAGSSVLVDVERFTVDTLQTVVKAVTTLPVIIRVSRTTGPPTNGTTLNKFSEDLSRWNPIASVVSCLGDASADGTGSTTALTQSLTAGSVVAQEFAPRMITAAGYEMFDRTEFFSGDEVYTLGAQEGLTIFLDYTTSGSNPTTDSWLATVRWTEYTAAP